MKLRALVIALALSASMFGLPGAQAQEELGGIYFTEEVLSSTLTPGCSSYIPMYAATSQIPEGEGGVLVPSFAAGGLACASSVTYTAEADYVLAGAAVIDLYYSCTVAGALQDLWIDFVHNGNLISESNSLDRGLEGLTDPIPCNAGDVILLQVPIATGDIAVVPGDTLQWDIILFENVPSMPYNPTAHEENVHIKVNSPDHPSGFYHAAIPKPVADVPVDEGPGVSIVNLTDNITTPDSAEIAVAFPNATSGSLTYNWTQNLTALDAFLDGFVENGTARLSLTDANNVTVFDDDITPFFPAASSNGTGNGTGNATTNATSEPEAPSPFAMIRNATAGNWTIRIDVENFTGELILLLHAPPASGDDGSDTKKGSAPSGDEDKGSDDDEETGFGTVQSKESPGIATPLLLAGLALVVLQRRRQI